MDINRTRLCEVVDKAWRESQQGAPVRLFYRQYPADADAAVDGAELPELTPGPMVPKKAYKWQLQNWVEAELARLTAPLTSPKTGARCTCKPGMHRDNCPACEGSGWAIDFAAIHARVRAAVYQRELHTLAMVAGAKCPCSACTGPEGGSR